MKKRVIWLTGSMGSGKSTQRRNLCNAFADAPAKAHEGQDDGVNYHFTNFGSVSCIGKVKQEANGETSACDGLDSVFGKVKKEGGLYTVAKALQVSQIVVLEGSQTSPSWAELLQPTLKQYQADLYLVHLKMSYWDNFLRLVERQESKEGTYNYSNPLPSIYRGITDKNVESLIGKNRQFNNCFDKCEGIIKHRRQIDATQTADKVFEDILAFVFSDL